MSVKCILTNQTPELLTGHIQDKNNPHEITLQQIGAASNPNLLDNWYFANPVDQRGGYVVPPGTVYLQIGTTTQLGTTSTYYAVDGFDSNGAALFTMDGTQYYCNGQEAVRGYTGTGYGIDRWKILSNSVSMTLSDDSITIVNSGGVTNLWFAAQFLENSEELVGKNVTISTLIRKSRADMSFRVSVGNDVQAHSSNTTDLQLVTATRVVSQNSDGYIQVGFVTDSGGMAGDSIAVYAIKLELGSQQTLARQENGVWVLNEIPNYAEQMAICSQYNPTTGEYIGGAVSSTIPMFFSINESGGLRITTY